MTSTQGHPGADPAEIYAEAHKAACDAVAACGPENTQALNCGFAWVRICPARGPFVSYLKSRGIGDKHWHSGWWVENPGDFMGQQVDHKLAGARAFAEVLQRHGLNASIGSRMD